MAQPDRSPGTAVMKRRRKSCRCIKGFHHHVGRSKHTRKLAARRERRVSWS